MFLGAQTDWVINSTEELALRISNDTTTHTKLGKCYKTVGSFCFIPRF
jgi:hypothetical protein